MPDQQRFMVSGYEPVGERGRVIFTFVPRGLQHERGPGGMPGRVPQYIVAVHQIPDGLNFDWSGSHNEPGQLKEVIEQDIRIRMGEREIWIARVRELVYTVDQFAKELGWITREVEKKLDDPRVGPHRVPALLMQSDTCRIILEPVGRSAPGAEGVVDLYLMPGYDDIASIYYDGRQWLLHYAFPNHAPAAATPEATARPLSKEALAEVLAEIKRHAA